MKENERKVTLYIAMSLDGYIARSGGDIDWLSIVETPGEDYGYHEFLETIDTVIMGRKTYDKILSFGIDFPHRDKKCYVITRSQRMPDDNAEFYNGDLKALISKLKSRPGKNIFIDGGAELVNALMAENLIDEYVISIIPILLGGGIRLFNEESSEKKIHLIEMKKFPSGLVQVHYTLS